MTVDGMGHVVINFSSSVTEASSINLKSLELIKATEGNNIYGLNILPMDKAISRFQTIKRQRPSRCQYFCNRFQYEGHAHKYNSQDTKHIAFKVLSLNFSRPEFIIYLCQEPEINRVALQRVSIKSLEAFRFFVGRHHS